MQEVQKNKKTIFKNVLKKKTKFKKSKSDQMKF